VVVVVVVEVVVQPEGVNVYGIYAHVYTYPFVAICV